MSSDGSDVDDASASAAEQRKKCLGDGDLAEDVDVEDFLYVGGTGILHRTHHPNPGDIDQGIESTALELAGNQFGCGRDRRAIFDVHDQRREIVAEVGFQFVGITLLANSCEYVPAGINHPL